MGALKVSHFNPFMRSLKHVISLLQLLICAWSHNLSVALLGTCQRVNSRFKNFECCSILQSKSSRKSSADTGHCNSQKLTRGRRLMWRLQILGFIQKEIEKQERYQDLPRKMKNLWNTKRRATPVAVEVRGSVSRALKGHLGQLEISDRKRKMQRKEKKHRHLSLD